jgi:HAD superfamily hydrolase (TIGR01509 family)
VSERWIVFDLIGVLAEPSWREIATGGDDAWRSFKRGERAEALFWDAAHAAAYRRVLSFRRDRLTYVRALKARGYHICLASNFSREWLVALLAKGGAAGLFDAQVVSAEVGAAKPDPAFFDEVRCHAPPGSIFVDDQKANCDAAERAGLRAIFAYPGCSIEAEVERLLRGGH